ncbi:hypothetical protein [Halomonas citrativorans]|uniref:Wzt C-terminal domain-containing protein n=1 Tax=Halomonas citrativorans TaxID=2742612 RepID=A0ABR9FFA3_9GAMM|nr:hypothetical protein [Halomonas citrativorans]MBE0405180.1 hypothetical protein [Halomonas citrativorans]
MDFASLRRRNKQVLVEHAFNIFLPEIQKKKIKKDYWVERLLDGYDVSHFIQDLKQGRTETSGTAVSSLEISSDTIGSIQVVDQNLDLHAGLKRKIQVRICNYQADTFQTTPEKPLFVAYHWYRAGGEVYEFDGVRTSLKASVEQGREIEMAINLTPPAEPGDYQLMVTMVYEGRYWMEEVGLSVQRLGMTVQDYDGRGLSRHALSIFKQLQAAELEVIN